MKSNFSSVRMAKNAKPRENPVSVARSGKAEIGEAEAET
jgi:hypothetical protein